MPGAIDYEIMTRLHPEPPSEEELNYMKDIDPTAAGIFLHKLHTIAFEGNETVVKLGASTGCRWGDTACAIYTKSGDSAICASGLYFHAILGGTDIKYIMKYWVDDPSVGVKPGDAFFCNYPFYRSASRGADHPVEQAVRAGELEMEVYPNRQQTRQVDYVRACRYRHATRYRAWRVRHRYGGEGIFRQTCFGY